jgi:hypothetical protein
MPSHRSHELLQGVQRRPPSSVPDRVLMHHGRTWATRLGAIAEIGLLAAATYYALWTPPHHCPRSTPTRRYACDPPPPTHPHVGLALALGVASILLWLAVAVGSWRVPRE